MSCAPAYAQSTEPTDAKAPRVKVNPAFEECHKRAVAIVDTPARRNKEGGDVVGHLLFGFGIAGAVITSIKNENDKQKAIEATEHACLVSKGLATKAAPAATEPVTRTKADRGAYKGSVVHNGDTAPGATRTCTNKETSCSAAYSHCQNNCVQRNAGSGCTSDCDQASTRCLATGTWRTQNCLKTGMVK